MVASPFITAEEYPSVRRAISVTVTEDILPDVVIGDPVYLDRAVAEVTALVPDAASRTGEEQARVKRAMILTLAARLIPALPNLKQEQFQDFAVSYQASNPMERAAQLLMQASAELAPLLAVNTVRTAIPGMAAGKAPRVRGNLWENPYDPY